MSNKILIIAIILSAVHIAYLTIELSGLREFTIKETASLKIEIMGLKYEIDALKLRKQDKQHLINK
jgi:hypothetical protein